MGCMDAQLPDSEKPFCPAQDVKSATALAGNYTSEIENENV